MACRPCQRCPHLGMPIHALDAPLPQDPVNGVQDRLHRQDSLLPLAVRLHRGLSEDPHVVRLCARPVNAPSLSLGGPSLRQRHQLGGNRQPAAHSSSAYPRLDLHCSCRPVLLAPTEPALKPSNGLLSALLAPLLFEHPLRKALRSKRCLPPGAAAALGHLPRTLPPLALA
eukprot:1431311-Lingulodinium_polyedra.AAC.1